MGVLLIGLVTVSGLAGCDVRVAGTRCKIANATAQDKKFVLVLGPDNKVTYRAVRLGPIVDGLRSVREGLKAGEVIVVNGLQRVRPGMPVTPQQVAMGEDTPKPANGAGAKPAEPQPKK